MESAYEREASAEEREGLGACGRLEPNPRRANQGPEFFNVKESNRSNNPDEAVEQSAAVQGAVLAVRVLHIAGLLYFSMECSWLMMLEETCNQLIWYVSTVISTLGIIRISSITY